MSNFRIYNDTLCPQLWDTAQHLDPVVRLNLLRMAYDFYKKTNLPAQIQDVYLMGSIANYNWTPDSDADVHVIIDYSQLQMPEQTANKTVKTAGAQWNAEHHVTVKGFKVEMNIQNSAEQKPHVTGIYSLVKDQWVRHPVKMVPQIDKGVIQVQYKAMQAYIENSIRSGDREQMKAAKKYLDAYRQYGLDTYGELSYENITFKILRSKGIIKQLKDAITAVYDKEMTVKEVGEKDIRQTLPDLTQKFDRKYWSKFDREKGDFNMTQLTLDELKALREKAERFYRSNPEDVRSKQEFLKYDAEIKRRLAYINKPITEAPDISLNGKKAMIGNKPLKDHDVAEVYKNIVVVRQGTEGGFLPYGWTLVYFMDSEESAEAMHNGQIPYLMIPIGTWYGGGNPITDVWKKKFQKPGHEHILGLIQGTSTDEAIFIDMISVRAKWQRNHIAKLMLDRLKKTFPNAKIVTSSRTDKGEKWAKGMGIAECSVGSGIPEDDRLKIHNQDGSVRRWQIRSKDAPKTPQMTDTPPKAIKKFDPPIKK